jgi:hypothetical protein
MKIFDFKKILRYFNREKEWQLIVVVFALFLTALISVNIYIFLVLEKEAQKPILLEENIQTLKRDILKNVLDGLYEKEKQFNQNILTKPGISDPSL